MRQFDEYESRLASIGFEPVDSAKEVIAKLRSGTQKVDLAPSANAATSAAVKAKVGVVVFPIGAEKESDDQYLYEGLVEEVTNMLGQASDLRVVPRESAFARRPRESGSSETARRLGVTHAVEGRTRVVNGERRLQLKLIDAEREIELWSDDSPASLTPSDVFALEDRIAERVLSTLGRQSDARPKPVRRPETSVPEAHALYLRGRHAWFTRTREGLHRALELFQDAVRLDPRYARAYAGIADAYSVMNGHEFTVAAPADLYLPARAAAERALEVNPHLSEAHAALGCYRFNYEWDWAGAEESFLRAIDLNPGYSSARQWYSNLLMCLKREDEAIAEATLALELDPRSAYLSSSLGRHFQLMRQPHRALEQYHRALEMDPAFPSAHMGLALAELQTGRVELAIERLERMTGPGRSPAPVAHAILAYALGIAGEDKRATSIVQRIKATSDYLPCENVALGYIGLGELDRALEWLEKALKLRSQAMILLNVEPIFDPLRHEPRFVKLLETVGFKPAPPPPPNPSLPQRAPKGRRTASKSPTEDQPITPADTYYLPSFEAEGGSLYGSEEGD
jgi:TolB-like protein/Tfp pilus assembly protein PilF